MKKSIKTAISLFLVITLISAMALSTFAAVGTYDVFEWDTYNGYVRITSVLYGTTGNVTVPETINGVPVKYIKDNACVSRTGITGITFPSSIEEIGPYAFVKCHGLTSITLPPNVTVIEEDTFYHCQNLSRFNFNKKVEVIEEEAFARCYSLTSITLPNSLTTIGYHAFYDCTNLSFVRIPHNVTSIDATAFGACSPNLIIVGCAGSYAQTYANANGIRFAVLPCEEHAFVQGTCSCCGVLLGDLNSDGVRDLNDYSLMVGYVANPSSCPAALFEIADMNHDGILNDGDRVILLEILLGIYVWPA